MLVGRGGSRGVEEVRRLLGYEVQALDAGLLLLVSTGRVGWYPTVEAGVRTLKGFKRIAPGRNLGETPNKSSTLEGLKNYQTTGI